MSACIARNKGGVNAGSILHKIQLTSPITQWPEAFREAMKREDLSPVTVRGDVLDLEMLIAGFEAISRNQGLRDLDHAAGPAPRSSRTTC